MSPRIILALAGLMGFLSVALGAFGAHALKTKLSADMLAIFETGVRYQMYHAITLIGVGILAIQFPQAHWSRSAICFSIGTLIFSGSLYALVGSGIKVLGAITPIGGLFLLAGWGLFIASSLKSAA